MVKCYSCQKMGHYAYECCSGKKKKEKEKKVNLVALDEKDESALLVTFTEELEIFLL